MSDNLIELQLWQQALLENPEGTAVLGSIYKYLNSIRPVVDARWNLSTAPESIAALADAQAAFENTCTLLSGRSSSIHPKAASSAELQEQYGALQSLWQLLQPFWQGESVASCDAGAAEGIQDAFLAFTEDTPEEPEEPEVPEEPEEP